MHSPHRSRTRRTHRRRGRNDLGSVSRTALLAVSAVAVLAMAGCSSKNASTRADDTGATTTTAVPVASLPAVPAGTKLRIGDQLDYLKTVLAVSGQDQDLPYELEYANFVGGPPMLQAFQGGALDGGFVASTPVLFAQAAGQDISAVAGWAPEKGLGGLITTDPDITEWADLKGKRIAYQRSTSAEAAVLTGLDSAGLTIDDITTVDVPITQVAATIKNGSADAGVSTEPLISMFVNDTPGGRVAIDANDITDRSAFLIASNTSLTDDAVSAALADYTVRLVKAFTWLSENKGALAESVFAKQYGLTPDRALELAESTGPTRFFELPGPIGEAQQTLADLFFAAGQIPAELDTAKEFDPRFNDLVATTADELAVELYRGS